MIKSMTGYGRGEKLCDYGKITVEIKSVNNRYFDYSIRLYKQYSFIEDAVRECVSSRISRGKVDVFVQYDLTDGDDRVVTLNESVAAGYISALGEVCEKHGLKNDVTASTLARFSDIFNIEKQEQDKEKIIADTKEAVNLALDDITDNRAREGGRIRSFFVSEICIIRDIISLIKTRSADTVDEYRARLKDRIEEMLENVEVDEGRLLTEVAIFSDKVNITEELVRFESHLKEFESLLDSSVPIGRKLDFTIQELNREANTMGSKCNDFAIGKAVVDLKAELEKLREQVQNIE